MRLVLDTSVLIAALRSRLGASRRLLDYANEGRIQLIASSAMFLEYEAVLTRPEHVMIHGFSLSQVNDFLISLAAITEQVRTHFSYRPQLRDAGDEMVLEAAINGASQAIVTHNTRDFLPAALSFGLQILTPASIIKSGLI